MWTNESFYQMPYNSRADVCWLMAERYDTKPNVKLGVFQPQLEASYMSSHTEELWYNKTVSLWMAKKKYIYIYIYICVCVCVCVYVYMYFNIYRYIHWYKHFLPIFSMIHVNANINEYLLTYMNSEIAICICVCIHI